MANRIFNYLIVLILVLISFVIGFSTGKTSNSMATSSNPTWWMSESVDSSLMYFYGTATAVSEDIALHRAESRARTAVIDYINRSLGETGEEETTGYWQKMVISKMRRNNSMIVELPAKGIYKTYVQIEIPVTVLEELADKDVVE